MIGQQGRSVHEAIPQNFFIYHHLQIVSQLNQSNDYSLSRDAAIGAVDAALRVMDLSMLINETTVKRFE